MLKDLIRSIAAFADPVVVLFSIPVVRPTKEFRESLTKLAAASTEKAKTIIRKLRQDGMKDLKDLKAGMSEDENYQLEKKVNSTSSSLT